MYIILLKELLCFQIVSLSHTKCETVDISCSVC